MTDNKEYVNVELVFGENDTETIQLPKDVFINIQQLALVDDVSFEEKFLELLKKEISEHED